MQNVQLLIHGRSVDASNQATFERISPIDGSVASKAAAATLEDVDRAIESAQQAFKVWSKLSPTERRLRLLKAADLMDQKTEQFIETGMQETGSTATWYGFNVHLAANMLREAAAMTTQIDGSLIPSDVPAILRWVYEFLAVSLLALHLGMHLSSWQRVRLLCLWLVVTRLC